MVVVENALFKSLLHINAARKVAAMLNAVVTAFLLDISTFLSFPYVPEVHPYRWRFLEGHLGYLNTYLPGTHLSEEDNLLGLYFSILLCM